MPTPMLLKKDNAKAQQKPLTELLQRSRRAERTAGGTRQSELDEMHAVYTRLGKLAGR